METIRGRMSLDLNLSELTQRLADYDHITLDLGTGDGQFVRHMAERQPETFFIGMDACRENLRVNSQRKLNNALFVIANAQALPFELHGLARRLTINFPWGSLLHQLLNADPGLLDGLNAVTRSGAGLLLHLNADALATAGWSLEAGADQVESVLNAAGWPTRSRANLNAQALRSFPSTWAKRLAFGRAPRAIQMSFERL